MARQRLGVRRPSAAFLPQTQPRKAAEGRRIPKPRGIFHPALKIGHSFIETTPEDKGSRSDFRFSN
jgi:hypothetical protein